MERLTTLLLTLLVLGSCASTPPDPSKDFKATASAPDLEQFIDESFCWVGCKDNITFSCDSMPSAEAAKSCAVNKCVAHYQYLKDSPYWQDKNKDVACVVADTSSYSRWKERNLKFTNTPWTKYEFGVCINITDCDPLIEELQISWDNARNKNRSLYVGPKKQAELDRAKAIYEANIRANRELERTQRLQAEAEERKLQAQREEFLAYIEMLKENCESFGFTEDNAIATCVQREINLERDRIQARQIAQQNQLIIQQAQPSNRSSQSNLNALRSMGNCLQTEGSFVACSNAWEGYSPPKKIVTKCRYDALGNAIIGTCTTQ